MLIALFRLFHLQIAGYHHLRLFHLVLFAPVLCDQSIYLLCRHCFRFAAPPVLAFFCCFPCSASLLLQTVHLDLVDSTTNSIVIPPRCDYGYFIVKVSSVIAPPVRSPPVFLVHRDSLPL